MFENAVWRMVGRQNKQQQNYRLRTASSQSHLWHFIKIFSHYKKIGNSFNVLQQTACLVVNPITVGNFAFLFNYTPVGWTSDYYEGSDLNNYQQMRWIGPDALAVVRPTCWISFWFSVLCTIEYLSLPYLLLISLICFIYFLYLDLYVLGDNSWICLGSFMQTKHLCVLIHIYIKDEVSAVILV